MNVGIDIGGTNIKIGIVKEGKIISKKIIPALSKASPEVLIEVVVSEIKKLGVKNIKRIGIGIAGFIDHKKGIVRASPNLPLWKNVRLKEKMESFLKIPVHMGNDVNAIAVGEYLYGGYGVNDLFVFTLGTGVGGGFIINGKLITGENDTAGEFGHITIDPKGPICKCGKNGCLERYVGAEYLVQYAKRLMKKERSTLIKYKKFSPKEIAKEARKGDKVAVKVFDYAGEKIAYTLAQVIQLIDPSVIIVSGGISKAGRLILEPIKRHIKKYLIPLKKRKLRIVISRLKENAGILGASEFYRFIK